MKKRLHRLYRLIECFYERWHNGIIRNSISRYHVWIVILFCIKIFHKSTSYCVNLHLSSVPIYDRCHWGHCKKLWYLNSTTHQTFIYSLSPPLYGSLSHEISTSISCIWNKCPFMHFWQWPVTYTLKTAFMIYITKEKSFFVCLIVKTNHEISNRSKKSLHIFYVITWSPSFLPHGF